jgi:hypothetical protein
MYIRRSLFFLDQQEKEWGHGVGHWSEKTSYAKEKSRARAELGADGECEMKTGRAGSVEDGGRGRVWLGRFGEMNLVS